MKPRPWCSETVEDAEIWLRLLDRAPLEQGLLRFTMWNHYRTADRRDADIMLKMAGYARWWVTLETEWRTPSNWKVALARQPDGSWIEPS